MSGFESPLRLLRELKGAPLAIVIALQIAQTRVTQSWLAMVTDYSDKIISEALYYLETVGLVSHTSSGWQLARAGVEILPLPVGYGPGSGPALGSGLEHGISDSDLSLEEEEESMSNLIIDSSSSDLDLKPEKPETADLVTIQAVLDAAFHLFNAPIMGDPEKYQNLDYLLGWIAQAYALSGRGGKPGRVRSPAGLIFWAFSQGKAPDRAYLEKPEDYLPDRFLRETGLWEF